MTRPRAALLLCGLLMGAAALAGCAGGSTTDEALNQNLARADVELNAGAAQAMISSLRSSNGLPPVVLDPELMRMAREQANAMAAHDKMDHNVWRPFEDRIRGSEFRRSVAVENIAAGDDTLAEAFSSWRGSPPHRANMLNRDVTRMGIAAVYAPGSKYKVFWDLILAGDPGAARLNANVAPQ
jgi:uncharacterized protein YkwD